MARKLSKTEERILAQVHSINRRGVLAGLSNFQDKFVMRLQVEGRIVWRPWTPKLGAGWLLPENARWFKENE